MNLHDKAQFLTEEEKQELQQRFREMQRELEHDDQELERLDKLIRKAEEAEQEMNKPITS